MGSYNYTGNAQFVTVTNTGGSQYAPFTIKAYGAQGGSSSAAGGDGAETQGYFALYSGEKLEIIVGGEGASGDAYHGLAGSGGGETAVFKVNSNGSLTPLIVAGGGGGAKGSSQGGAGSYSSKNQQGVVGGGGGAYGYGPYGGGGAGVKYNGVTAPAYRGAAGGGGGFNRSGNYAGGGAGYNGYRGGFGGGGGSTFEGPGGGGGYAGGNGGTEGQAAGGGGSYISSTAIDRSGFSGVHSGNGLAVITPAFGNAQAPTTAAIYDTSAGQDLEKAPDTAGNTFGFSFTTGSASTLKSYEIAVNNPGGGTGTISTYIYSNSANNTPGTELYALGTENDSAFASGATLANGTGNGFTFAADTRYWLVAVNSANSNLQAVADNGSPGIGYANQYDYDSSQSTTQSFANGSTPLDGQILVTVCFAAGTAIRTTRGDIAIETLAVGDLAITASGQSRPIRWIGQRTFDCATHRDPAMVRPIRVQAGAFGGGKPTHDLLLSPHHAVAVACLGEVLVPIRLLTNGSTIAQLDDVAEITYWHVELDSHDVILANGLPAESYIDVGNRCDFEGEASLTLHPEFRSQALAGYCRPLVTGGTVLAAIRRQLAELAGEAPTPAEDTMSALYLLVGGERIAPVVRGHNAAFLVPAGAGDMRLVSPTFSPREIDPASRDDRRLGLMIEAVFVDDLFGTVAAIPLEDPALVAGFHPLESGPAGIWRWTTGDALLSGSLFAGRTGPCLLRLTGQFVLPSCEGATRRRAA